MDDQHGRTSKPKPKPLKQQKTRRGGVKHRSKTKVKFSLLGNNSAGLKSKKDSLEAIIEIFKTPSCITLQETKLPKNANFHLNDYQVFLKNRNSSGGGLLTAIDPNLNPMLIAPKNEEAEILTVQLELNEKQLRVINFFYIFLFAKTEATREFITNNFLSVYPGVIINQGLYYIMVW